MGYRPWGRKELDTTERVCARARAHTHTHTHAHTLPLEPPVHSLPPPP